MESKEYQGKITWISPSVQQYQGQDNIGLKIEGQDTFFNIYKTKEELKEYLTTLKKGYEIKFAAEGNMIQTLEITSTEVKEDNNFSDDMISFEYLLKEGHNQGLKYVDSEVISCDFEKQQALVKVTIETEKGKFTAHGDATAENCKSSFITPHFLRMAETRGLARALRFATNTAKTAKEEI